MSKVQTLETPAGPAVLKRTARKTLAISVLPDGSLELRAPSDTTEEAILARVSKRSRWIATQRSQFNEMNSTRTPRRYVTGATHRYLGRQYRLKIHSGTPPSVTLKGAYFHVVSPSPEPSDVKKHLDLWFRQKANYHFTLRLAQWDAWCQRQQLPQPKLMLRRMPKRWGSAAKDGSITLNPDLIHAPSACINYVIAHEICHLKHAAHSPAFFRLLAILQPDWRTLKDRLERANLT